MGGRGSCRALLGSAGASPSLNDARTEFRNLVISSLYGARQELEAIRKVLGAIEVGPLHRFLAAQRRRNLARGAAQRNPGIATFLTLFGAPAGATDAVAPAGAPTRWPSVRNPGFLVAKPPRHPGLNSVAAPRRKARDAAPSRRHISVHRFRGRKTCFSDSL